MSFSHRSLQIGSPTLGITRIFSEILKLPPIHHMFYIRQLMLRLCLFRAHLFFVPPLCLFWTFSLKRASTAALIDSMRQSSPRHCLRSFCGSHGKIDCHPRTFNSVIPSILGLFRSAWLKCSVQTNKSQRFPNTTVCKNWDKHYHVVLKQGFHCSAPRMLSSEDIVPSFSDLYHVV